MCIEDEGFMHMDSKESEVASMKGAKLCDNGNVKSELLEADVGNKCHVSMKRKHCCVDNEDLINLHSKKEKNRASPVDDERLRAMDKSGSQILSSDGKDDVMIRDLKKEASHHKKKRSPFLSMLNWLNRAAKNPCAPGVGQLPERSKWSSYGHEELWKQVLLAREAIFYKRVDGKDTGDFSWQRGQKMDLRLYDDNTVSTYNLRERAKKQKLSPGEMLSRGQSFSESFTSGGQNDLDKSPSTFMVVTEDNAGENITCDSSTVDSLFGNRAHQKVPLGIQFQAQVPAWNGVQSESDSKWLGTQVWPTDKSEKKIIIERDPIGKGRQDECGCQIRGSTECVRFHIAEKRLKLKIELGSAFYRWRFHKMGEEVKLSWTEEEQNKFTTIMKMNPLSEDKCFWDPIFTAFPKKSREELVSYYFNVFLLQRRGCQNRVSPDDINSDDDEAETSLAVKWGSHQENKSTSSIFYSPTKAQSNSR